MLVHHIYLYCIWKDLLINAFIVTKETFVIQYNPYQFNEIQQDDLVEKKF